MELYDAQPVANGLRTDHPLPDLPFVDDAHIPVEEPEGIEAIGRRPGTDMWGREDRCGNDDGWIAFTTDPTQHDLAWVVRWHPGHGRSVVLYRNDDVSGVHMAYWGPALLFRAGGYWWDGSTWYRPSRVWDPAGEDYVRRPVPAALTVTAADLLTGRSDPEKGTVVTIGDVEAAGPYQGRWADDLAVWASRREGGLPLASCVVNLAAPELTGDQLIGPAELAKIGGVAPSTLRAYISRGEADIPAPQATIGGRNAWARPVAEEWAETRRTSPDSLREAITAGQDEAPPGITHVWDRYTRLFFSALWDNTGQRKRWALRWRNQAAVHDVARGLGWTVAADVQEGNLIGITDLARTARHAVLDELAAGQQLDHGNPDPVFYGISAPVARTLDWVIRHNPTLGAATLAEIIGESERRLGIARPVSARSLRTALNLDSELSNDSRRDYLDRVLTPALTGQE